MVLKGNKSDSHCLSPHRIHLEWKMWWQRTWTISYFCEEIPHLLSDLLFYHVPRPKSSRIFLREGVFEFILWACACLLPAESGCYYSTLKNCLASARKYLPNNRFTIMLNKMKQQPVIFFYPSTAPPSPFREIVNAKCPPTPSNGHVEKDLCYFPLRLFKHHKWHVWVDESWC